MAGNIPHIGEVSEVLLIFLYKIQSPLMDFLIFLIILYFRNVIEEPSLPVKSQKGRSTGLGEDFKEKGVQPVILFLVSVKGI